MTNKKYIKPRKIGITWVDPWNGEFCSGAVYSYTSTRAANGFFSKSANALKKVAKQWTGVREPSLKVEIIK